MAFDLFPTPASSLVDERQFSMAGCVLDEGHCHTLDDLEGANRCLKSAHSEELMEQNNSTTFSKSRPRLLYYSAMHT